MIDWIDLHFKDLGASQIENKKELALKRKKMMSFYKMILKPLYNPIQNSKKFKFSVSDEELTEKIMYQDLMRYYKLHTAEDVLKKIGELNPDFKPKIEPLMERIKEVRGKRNR